MRVLIWQPNEEQSFWNHQHRMLNTDWLIIIAMHPGLLLSSLQKNPCCCSSWKASSPNLCSSLSPSDLDSIPSSLRPVSLWLYGTLCASQSNLCENAIFFLWLCIMWLIFTCGQWSHSIQRPTIQQYLFFALGFCMVPEAPFHKCMVLIQELEVVWVVQEKRL